MSINIFYDRVKFRLPSEAKVKWFINKVIQEKGLKTGDLNFIFMSDQSLLKLNKEFLRHDYFTDVITFSFNKDDVINGEVYISIERVRINSNRFKTTLYEEINRVMVHGILHLCGMNDENEEEKKAMRIEEDKYLRLFGR